MSKAASSFYDWERSFRTTEQDPSKKKDHDPKKVQNKKKITETSLGISKEEFRNHVKEWKRKNL